MPVPGPTPEPIPVGVTLSMMNIMRRVTMPVGTELVSVACEDDPTECCDGATATTMPGYTLRVEKTTLRVDPDEFQWVGDEFCETVSVGNCCVQGDPIQTDCCDDPIPRVLRFFVASGACPGLILNDFTDLEYDDGEGKWIGTYTGPSSDSFIVRIWCSAGSWTGDIACSTAPTERSTLVADPDTGACNPIYIRFDTTIDWVTCSGYFGCTPIINVYGAGADPDVSYALQVTKRVARIRVRTDDGDMCVSVPQCCAEEGGTVAVDCCGNEIPRTLYATATLSGSPTAGCQQFNFTMPIYWVDGDYTNNGGFGGASCTVSTSGYWSGTTTVNGNTVRFDLIPCSQCDSETQWLLYGYCNDTIMVQPGYGGCSEGDTCGNMAARDVWTCDPFYLDYILTYMPGTLTCDCIDAFTLIITE